MTNESVRTLGQVIEQNTEQVRGQTGTDQENCFRTYLEIFALNIVHRFPDLTNLEDIEVTKVQNIARFSLACSNVALTTWNTMTQVTGGTRQRLQRSA